MENNYENENFMNNEKNESDNANSEITVKKGKEKNLKRELLEWAVAIVVAFGLAFIIRTFFFNLVAVSGPSMESTLHNGERLVVSRFNYNPKQGDIVVFTPDLHPNTPYVKRVIATEGQTVDIDSRGVVYVDGKVYEEDYVKNKTTLNGDVEFPITVPEDCVFVMGDNRAESHDGRSLDVSSVREDTTGAEYYTFERINDDRTIEVLNEPLYYGCVHEDDIMGKVVFRFWPIGKFGGVK